jgi:hypothetical protein
MIALAVGPRGIEAALAQGLDEALLAHDVLAGRIGPRAVVAVGASG